ncbi:MAG: nucleoside recognition domain-containing protein [Varibaculum cambriense]|uniref:nucleoside recognition domain-containing protein n=1 Tax=Varibaculum cambriense TaxID=184870 RepID=UPI002911A7F8|nr:nucleoside recognition domain-containing protein [Varibaculum cambriense]MDU6680269.1 nucleoside recognition domain-containing protein [Varibaculum cambriense]
MADSPALLRTVIADGLIGGVGAVIGFLPLVMVMYFLLALLEESGYMARVSAVLDPIFKRVGLSGKSVIPHRNQHRLRHPRDYELPDYPR